MDKILVVNEGGELLRFKAMQQDLLYESLLKNHCYHTAYYLNSFDRLSLQENRARALFLVNKPDANTIFAKYQADRGYGDALELGVVYRTEFEKMLSVSVSGDEYHVTFSSVLSIINGNDVRKIRILSEGTVIRTTPRFRRTLPDFLPDIQPAIRDAMTKTERSRIVALGGIGAVIILLVWGIIATLPKKRTAGRKK